ncbi:MAG: PhzF family phenazine biosynthesis protein [Pseudomonadota bacterium]
MNAQNNVFLLDEIQRLSAFTFDGSGGNLAGVLLLQHPINKNEMQKMALQIGYSETAFAHFLGSKKWRVRYFSPFMEVPFCGHATIALGVALGKRYGESIYELELNDGTITVEAICEEHDQWKAILLSPQAKTREAPVDLTDAIYHEFGISSDQLDHHFSTQIAHAGADHLLIGLDDRLRLSQLGYHFGRVKNLMEKAKLVTICFFHRSGASLFHTRNFFASGGVYEDSATGAATAALAGYLRICGAIERGEIEIIQGEDMGRKSRIMASFESDLDGPIRVSGHVSEISLD